MARDITLDGPLFRSFDTGVTREPLAGGLYVGIGIRYRDVEFSYVQTYRTDRFKEQTGNHQFGSLAMSYRF